MLAQAVDAHDGESGGVHGIDALFGSAGGMGGLALEVHFKVGAGNELLLENGAAFGMGGDDGVHLVEETGFGHGNLAAGISDVAFFSRSAENMNGACRKVTGQSHGGSAGGGAEKIVSAGMAEAGKGVEFGKESHIRAFAGAVDGMEGRGHVEQPALYLEAVFFKKIGKTGG